MPTIAKTLTLLLTLFALSFGLALYLDNKLLSMPSLLSAWLEEESEEIELSPLNTQAELIEPVPAILLPEAEFKEKHTHQVPQELGSYSVTCTDKIKAPSSKSIYTWIDENGIKTISDRPRLINNSTVVKVFGTVPPEAVSISFSGDSSNSSLHHEVRSRVLAVQQLFASITPKHLITPVLIDMEIFTDKHTYERYRKSISNRLAGSKGFYQASTNKSVVFAASHKQARNTAVHEAIHSINRHWFGKMARWLNEGLAEYAEVETPQHLKTSAWRNYLKNDSISLSAVFESSRDKWQNDASSPQMYGMSWAFVSFLMEQNPTVLSKLLLQESENGCDVLSTEDIERIYGRSISLIQRDFDRWRLKI